MKGTKRLRNSESLEDQVTVEGGLADNPMIAEAESLAVRDLGLQTPAEVELVKSEASAVGAYIKAFHGRAVSTHIYVHKNIHIYIYVYVYLYTDVWACVFTQVCIHARHVCLDVAVITSTLRGMLTYINMQTF